MQGMSEFKKGDEVLANVNGKWIHAKVQDVSPVSGGVVAGCGIVYGQTANESVYTWVADKFLMKLPPVGTPEPVKAGDIVWLRSGGPDMTVSSINNGIASCCYFNANTLVSCLIGVAALKKKG